MRLRRSKNLLFFASNIKTHFSFWVSVPDLLGSSRFSLRPRSREGLLAFGNRSFAPSAFAISATPPVTVYLASHGLKPNSHARAMADEIGGKRQRSWGDKRPWAGLN